MRVVRSVAALAPRILMRNRSLLVGTGVIADDTGYKLTDGRVDADE